MRRSYWLSGTLVILMLIITTSLLLNIFRVQANSTPSRGKLFVLIQGINTSLQNNNPPAESFGTRNGIAPYLSSVYPDAQFLMYSYNGDNGQGYPAAYQCQDTFASDAKADTFKLAKQLENYLKGKTNTDVYLVGHSFGGIIVFGYLSYLLMQHIANGSIPGTTGNRIAGVVTLDAPLGGVPNGLFLTKIVMEHAYIQQCPKLKGRPMPPVDTLFAVYKTGKSLPHGGNNSIAEALFKSDLTNQAIITESAKQGIHVLTIGNELDYLYDPAVCKLLFGHSLIGTQNYLSTQWLSDKGNGSGIYGRSFRDGVPTCGRLRDIGINHGMVFIARGVQAALGQFIGDELVAGLPVAL